MEKENGIKEPEVEDSEDEDKNEADSSLNMKKLKALLVMK